MKKLSYIFILTFTVIACTKGGLSQYRELYSNALDRLEITCSSGESENYVKCDFDDEQLCHFDGVDNRTFYYGYYTRFITPGPSISSVGSSTVLGRQGGIGFFDPEDSNLDGLQFWFPLVPPEQSNYEYLTNLFSEKELKYSNDVDSNLVDVTYVMRDKLKHTSGSINYNISSKHGPQDEGYFRIENVVIEEDESMVTFNFEFHFECEMYHDPQYRPGAHWRSLRNGIIKGSITTDKGE